MLEKFGLPPKPSLRGNNWVDDASHCQGCSSQFTFINRKHHCRRCGGLFCSSCTQHRMVLRGQGDSPVRICEPCKKLEEAARFEMRYGHKNRAGRGGSKLTSKDEDDVLHQILGGEHKQSLSSKSTSSGDMLVSAQQATRSASSSSSREVSSHDMLPDGLDVLTDVGNVTPEELRQQALEEKKKHKTLKLEGKPEEALKAFKRGKELENRARALEIELRKIRKKASSSIHIAEPSGVNDGSSSKSKDKDDIASELKDLGWSDLDLQDSAKKPTKLSVESELHALLGEVSEKPQTGRKAGGPDQSQVIAHKKKALKLKREGKLAEAKEELKKAKVLEKQIEEQELLGDDEESDEELSLLIRSMDEDKDDALKVGYNISQNFDVDPLVGFPDDIGLDNLDVTEDDMEDPELAAEMLSLGWNEETTFAEDMSQKSAINTEALLSEIQSLKKKAVSHKRAGNTGEALALFKKAKMLEKDLHTSDFQEPNIMTDAPVMVHEEPVNVKNELNLKSSPKSISVIRKELLNLKKSARTLRREGKSDESDEMLKKGKILEQQLQEMESTSKITQMDPSGKLFDSTMIPDVADEGEVDDQDLNDPTYLSMLKNLGWKEDPNDHILHISKEENNATSSIDSSVTQASNNNPPNVSRKTKSEIQRELLGLKRKSRTLRQQGQDEEAEEVLKMTKVLETQLADFQEMESTSKITQMDPSGKLFDSSMIPDVADEGEVDDQDLNDPTYLSMLKNLGWKEDPNDHILHISKEENNATSSIDSSVTQASNNNPPNVSRKTKSEIQRELLGLKRKSRTLRQQGQDEEAEEVLKMTKVLETQLADFETPPGKDIADEPSVWDPVEDLGTTFLLPTHPPEGMVSVIETPNLNNKSTEAHAPQNEASSLEEDIIAHKRRAVALKREGKIAEAKEELRQAKLLEKQTQENNSQTSTSTSNLSGFDVSSVGRNESSPNAAKKSLSPGDGKDSSPDSGKKPLSSRDRSKLQQQSLNHKRQARKLRSEGKTKEADAEYELAKALEAQLEESDMHDPTRASAEPVDNDMVEDFLDPQLLSALKAIGMGGPSSRSQRPETSEAKSISKMDNSEERSQLQEQIKAERLKALNLKKAGKTAEALDALRRAKGLEKKMNSLTA